ncbi:hypothetical protein MHBO_005014 [Bonamia ostreae]|uniref:Uncharacterized protein n=1 Tax=Bonamia ostreae TaxID=126728 RepID=A0ABV2AUW4_9EUKA
MREYVSIQHLFGDTVRDRNPVHDAALSDQDTEIAWDWDGLCEINVRSGIDPTIFLNHANFQVPHAVYNDEERLRKPDYWND